LKAEIAGAVESTKEVMIAVMEYLNCFFILQMVLDAQHILQYDIM
jgi:hypothetical protein